MVTQWMLDTYGDPLGRLRDFTRKVWELAGLSAMLAVINETQEFTLQPTIIENSETLNQVNPFKPLMTLNSARLVPVLMKKFQNARIGALFRPCEMRALIEMSKHDSFDLNLVFTICVDCLGTLPLEEFRWQAQRKTSNQRLTEETLKFARQGGILAYRYRSACQMCPSPEAIGADINIGVIGLPVRRYLLIEARNETVAANLHLDSILDEEADAELINQRRHVLARLHQRNEHTFERVTRGIADTLPSDTHGLAEQLDHCFPCQECMNNCPICTTEYPSRDANGRYDRNQIARWLISCVGCGMCEQACPQRLPLSAIFDYIRRQLTEAFEYTPGHSRTQPLPIHR